MIDNVLLKQFVKVLNQIRNNQHLPDYDIELAKAVFIEERAASIATISNDVKEAQNSMFGQSKTMMNRILSTGITHEAIRMAKVVYTRMSIEVK